MKAFQPEIVILPDRKMLVVDSVGDPNEVNEAVFGALYGTAYATRFKVYKPKGLVFKFGKLCAHWPDAHLRPRSEWHGEWALPVPEFYSQDDLIQKDTEKMANVVVWPGGAYAQILHKGPYSEEGPTVSTLHDFIESRGTKMSDVQGVHEEEYLTSPDSKVIKTIIRYRIK